MEYFKRLGNFWYQDAAALTWLAFALPALYFFQTTIHEGTHAFAALFETDSFPKLAPFPHLTMSGNFLNGVTLTDDATRVSDVARTLCDNPAEMPFRRLAGFIAAPQFVAVSLVALLSLIFAVAPIRNPHVRFWLRAWFFAASVDFMWNTARGLFGGCNEAADWSKFMLWHDIDPAAFAALTWFLWLGVLSWLLWLYWSKWGREQAGSAGFWDYRWTAFVLGLLSTICVILSFAISDDRIVKDNAAFIVPLVIQTLALLWYWLYFGLSFRTTVTGRSSA